MPSVEENSEAWNNYNWEGKGREWSMPWGGDVQQWLISVYPRIASFLPCKNILEIAVGCGRWTNFLQNYCEHYIGVDICKKAVDYCKKTYPKGEFFVNDGKSLDCVKNNSIDFCFSFDSLIHCEIDVIEAYISQILKKLNNDGIAFISYSNLAGLENVPPTHLYFATSVSSEKVREIILKNNGYVLIQENFSFFADNLMGGITVFHKNKEKYGTSDEVIENRSFEFEKNYGKKVISKYIPNYKKEIIDVEPIYFEKYPYVNNKYLNKVLKIINKMNTES